VVKGTDVSAVTAVAFVTAVAAALAAAPGGAAAAVAAAAAPGHAAVDVEPAAASLQAYLAPVLVICHAKCNLLIPEGLGLRPEHRGERLVETCAEGLGLTIEVN